ncbi:MAG TPA: hypothetical protein VEL07_14290 [Planctomycetota bacterium]|nr:hypothetical protein [Planctomycetota bacterium]
MPNPLAFTQVAGSTFPEFTATASGGTYVISKPPFAQQWRAAFMPDGAASERTVLERLGTGTFASQAEAVAACQTHRAAQPAR